MGGCNGKFGANAGAIWWHIRAHLGVSLWYIPLRRELRVIVVVDFDSCKFGAVAKFKIWCTFVW